MTTANDNTTTIAAMLGDALKAIDTAALIADTDSPYFGALTVAHLAIKEARKAALAAISTDN